MPKFQYQACDSSGLTIEGEIEASDVDAARAELERAGLRSVRVAPLDHQSARPLSDLEAAELSRNLAELTARSLPLAPGLRALAQELPAGKLRVVIAEVAGALDRGKSLAEALQMQGGRLPEHLRGLVLAGSRAGKLGIVLEEYVQQHQIGTELRQRAWMALAYPLVLLVFALGVFSFVTLFMVREFGDMYSSIGINMPFLTLFLISIANSYPWVLGGGVLATFLSWLAARNLLSPALRRRLVLRVPLLGPMWRWWAWAEFSHLLALLLDSEIPLPAALTLAGGGVRDADIADACRLIAADVIAGRALADSEDCRSRLPAILHQMLSWGESQRNLPDTLRTAGELFEGRARIQARLVMFIAPLLGLVAVVMIVCLSILALVLPMVNFLEAIS